MSKQHKYPSLADVKQGFANTSVATVRAQNANFLVNSAKLPRVVLDKTAGMLHDISASNLYYYACASARC